MNKTIRLFLICLWVIESYSHMSVNSDIWVMPETYVDDGKPYMEFTCGAFLDKGDNLTWYKPGGEYYTRIEQKHDDRYRVLTLLWPLQLAKNNSKIECVKEFKKSDGISDRKKKTVFISFQLQEEEEVLSDTWGPWVWPKTNIIDNSTNTVDLTCWAYLYKTGVVSWYQKQGNTAKTLATIQQETVWGYFKLELRKYIQPSDDGAQIYCGINDPQKGTKKSQNIELIYRRKEVSEFASSPQLTPSNFTDDGKSLMDFTCRAYLNATDLLSWFQVKASNTTERLETIQQDNNPGYKEIKLLKALKLSDNGTQIYCAKESVQSNGELWEGTKSDIIPIIFQKEKPYITVEPSKDLIIFEDKDVLTFVCGGSEPVNNRSYTWYIQDPYLHQIKLHQHINDSTNQNYLELHMNESYHESQLYCAQDYRLDLKLTGNRHKTVGYGELVRSKIITLLYQGKGNIGYPENPQVTPKNFVDDGKLYMEFTCFAYAQLGEVLSWYQSTGLDQSEDILLRMLQQDKSAQWMKLTLNKTLEPSDNNRDVYCAKQNVLQDGRFSKGLRSQSIEIRFQQDIKPLETFISIEPNTDVTFEVNSSLRFNCNGSAPVDGRNYTWFRIDSEYKLTIPEKQSQVSPNQSILDLFLNESYHQNQLLCAQVFLTKIQIGDVSLLKHYGNLVTSRKISLFLRDGLPLITILGIALPITLVVVAVAVAVCVLRRRRSPLAPPAAYKEENLYANVSGDMTSTEVTYAELQFSVHRPRNATNLRMDQTCEYATILPKSQC